MIRFLEIAVRDFREINIVHKNRNIRLLAPCTIMYMCFCVCLRACVCVCTLRLTCLCICECRSTRASVCQWMSEDSLRCHLLLPPSARQCDLFVAWSLGLTRWLVTLLFFRLLLHSSHRATGVADASYCSQHLYGD